MTQTDPGRLVEVDVEEDPVRELRVFQLLNESSKDWKKNVSSLILICIVIDHYFLLVNFGLAIECNIYQLIFSWILNEITDSHSFID
jgi:hypothetical protein